MFLRVFIRVVVNLVVVTLMWLGPGATARAQHRAQDVREVIAAAKAAIGTRYKYGGANLRGFDCSGLTMWAWEHVGISLPHNARMQHRATDHVRRRHLERGDLVFFYRPISHVGMYLGRGKMIHANHVGGSVRRSRVFWGHFSDGGRPE